jgi:hypothetical protein
MSAINPWQSDRQLHRARDNAASRSSFLRQPPDQSARAPAMPDAWERCGLTGRDLAAVRNIDHRLKSTQPFEMRNDQDAWADFQSSSFQAHPADAWADDPAPSRVPLWVRAVCLLLAAALALAGWVWLVRLLLGT